MNRGEDLQKIVEKLLSELSFAGKIAVTEDEYAYHVRIDLVSEQSLLIGQAGSHLAAFQHLVRLIFRKLNTTKEGYSKDVRVDVNGYWQEKKDKLSQEAKSRASEVVISGNDYIFAPMEAHDRKIIHDALALVEGIQTESFGSGRERSVRVFRSA
jgi:spoIIIJ-associated protein